MIYLCPFSSFPPVICPTLFLFELTKDLLNAGWHFPTLSAAAFPPLLIVCPTPALCPLCPPAPTLQPDAQSMRGQLHRQEKKLRWQVTLVRFPDPLVKLGNLTSVSQGWEKHNCATDLTLTVQHVCPDKIVRKSKKKCPIYPKIVIIYPSIWDNSTLLHQFYVAKRPPELCKIELKMSHIHLEILISF